MSPHTQIVFATWFAGVVSIAVGCFIAWLLWHLFFDIFDHLMQQRTRKRNNRFQPRTSRDCFRDMKGVTK